MVSTNGSVAAESKVAQGAPSTALLTTELQNLRSDLMSLAKAIMALQQRVADAEIVATEVRPQLLAVKVHSESLPQALREMRRANVALEKTVTGLQSRIESLEAR